MSLILVFTLATLRRYIREDILSKLHYVFLSCMFSMYGRTLFVGSSHLVPVEMVWPPQVFTLSRVGKTSPAAYLGLRLTPRYPGCERWKDCGRNDTPVPSNQQKFSNMACSTSAPVSKSRHSPGREWSGDSHGRVPKGLWRVTEEMPHPDCWPPKQMTIPRMELTSAVVECECDGVRSLSVMSSEKQVLVPISFMCCLVFTKFWSFVFCVSCGDRDSPLFVITDCRSLRGRSVKAVRLNVLWVPCFLWSYRDSPVIVSST